MSEEEYVKEIHELRKSKRNLLIISIVVTFFSCFMIFSYYVYPKNPIKAIGKGINKHSREIETHGNQSNINPKYSENVTKEEKVRFESYLNELDSEFKDLLRGEIYVKKNRTLIEQKCGEKKAIGCNIGKGQEIYIDLLSNEKNLKELLCHELMHTISLPQTIEDINEKEDYIINKMEEETICY